jgi:hypothetical protein
VNSVTRARTGRNPFSAMIAGKRKMIRQADPGTSAETLHEDR